MRARIVEFPETKIAAVEHRGSPETEHATARRLIDWRPRVTPADQHRVDFGVEYEPEIGPNPHGVIGKVIPGGRCAVARHLGAREFNTTAAQPLR